MLPYVYICYHVHYYICYFEETNPLIRAKMNMKIDLEKMELALCILCPEMCIPFVNRATTVY